MAELKVCPFCGGEAMLDNTDYGQASLTCSKRDCPASCAWFTHEEWNNRAAPAPRDEQGWEAKWQELQTEIGLTGDGARRVLELVGYDSAPVEDDELTVHQHMENLQFQLDGANDALTAANAKLEMALKVLAEHHQWHLDSGKWLCPDPNGGEAVEIDNAAEYCDSSLYERTIAAFAGACEGVQDSPAPVEGEGMCMTHIPSHQLSAANAEIEALKDSNYLIIGRNQEFLALIETMRQALVDADEMLSANGMGRMKSAKALAAHAAMFGKEG